MRLTFKKLALLGAHAARGVAKVRELTPARIDFIVMLVRGPLCQRDIAARLCVTEGVISRMVRVLMKLGFVRREIPEADKRFRVVSLTDFARSELARFNEIERFVQDDGRHDMQALGELLWRGDWDLPLDKMGLGPLAAIEQHDRGDGNPIEPPYAAIRRQIRSKTYRKALDFQERHVPLEWPWEIHDMPPPMHEGSAADPLSVHYARTWRLPAHALV